ncbi:hypothetical protein ACQ4M3_07665 [Leptolyngbya sp. AN03gr2]|uniref:hypothetical protein n=1 Tax=unclassified Leptolyngbya TaxID=2650499 RepID=UPI003D30F6D8
MINFNQHPHPFRVGDRCHLKETQVCPATQGTLSQLIEQQLPGCKVHWDDGTWSLQSTIALERIQFRPFRIPQLTWKELPSDYKGSYQTVPELIGYRNTLMYSGKTILVPIILVRTSISFDLGKTQWFGYDCHAIRETRYLILNHIPVESPERPWIVFEVDSKSDSSPSKCTYFRDWKNAYQFFEQQIQSSNPSAPI